MACILLTSGVRLKRVARRAAPQRFLVPYAPSYIYVEKGSTPLCCCRGQDISGVVLAGQLSRQVVGKPFWFVFKKELQPPSSQIPCDSSLYPITRFFLPLLFCLSTSSSPLYRFLFILTGATLTVELASRHLFSPPFRARAPKSLN